jgi:hypothetical protein
VLLLKKIAYCSLVCSFQAPRLYDWTEL